MGKIEGYPIKSDNYCAIHKGNSEACNKDPGCVFDNFLCRPRHVLDTKKARKIGGFHKTTRKNRRVRKQ